MKLFSKEKALYLVDNPTKWGFSWWFLWAGVAGGYWMHSRYGDSQFIIMVVEKYVLMVLSLFFFFVRRYVEKRVNLGAASRDGLSIYLTLPAGYVFVFLSSLWVTHIILGKFIV